MVRLLQATLLCLLLLAQAAPAWSQESGAQEPGSTLSAGIAPEVVAITTDFTGSRLTVFGAISPARQAGDEIAIILRGPPARVTLREKQQIGGMWINRGAHNYDPVPGVYMLASSAAVAELADQATRQSLGLGSDVLPLKPIDSLIEDTQESRRFSQAVISGMRQRGLFSFSPLTIKWDGKSLFRSEFPLPAAAHPGIYEVDVLLLRDGVLVDKQIKTLVLGKSGISARIANLAEDWPIAYALLALAIATLAGFIANRAMAKR